ncbi:ferric reductase-like transmembrane domain-containing protein [Thermaurantiacus sp.]
MGKPLLWLLLALPALVWSWQAAGLAAADLEELLPPTGELSARLLIVALAVTPLARLFPGRGWTGWLVRHRRALGVAAFGYAALHTLFYLIAVGTWDAIAAEAGAIGIWPGWAALALMAPLALTSNDAAMRALRAGWKRLHRLAYPAAGFALLHWIFVHNGLVPALLHAAPLAVLEAWRVVRPRQLQRN